MNFESRKEKILEILGEMFSKLGLNGTFAVVEKGEKIGVIISSEDPGRVIGRHGVMLESLQLLLNRMMFKMDDKCPLIDLDLDGYADGEKGGDKNGDAPARGGHGRTRRSEGRSSGESVSIQEQLACMAKDAAKEVKKWGESKTLPEMNARDRRIIHITLQDDPEITTESIGEGAVKKVVISLKKTEN